MLTFLNRKLTFSVTNHGIAVVDNVPLVAWVALYETAV